MKSLAKLLMILKTAHELDNDKSKIQSNRFNEIVSKWCLGKYTYNHDSSLIPHEVKDDKNKLYEHIVDAALDLKDELTPEGLSILYGDIKDVFCLDGVLSTSESNVLEKLRNAWNDKLIDMNKVIGGVISTDNENLKNNLVALSFIFYCAVKIDGSIDKLELMQIRRNLEVWNNHSARLILEAINVFEFVNSSGSFVNSFNDDPGITEVDKDKLINSIKYLKINETKEVRKIMYDQVMAIIKADSKITVDERWLSMQLRNIWNDIS